MIFFGVCLKLIDSIITENNILRNMTQSRRSLLTTLSDSDQIDQNQLNGLVAVLVGLSQLLLALVTLSDPDSLSFIVVAGGGILLLLIGVRVFQGKEVFEGEGNVSKRVRWLGTAMRVVFAIGVAVAAVSVSFGVAWLGTAASFIFILVLGLMVAIILSPFI